MITSSPVQEDNMGKHAQNSYPAEDTPEMAARWAQYLAAKETDGAGYDSDAAWDAFFAWWALT